MGMVLQMTAGTGQTAAEPERDEYRPSLFVHLTLIALPQSAHSPNGTYRILMQSTEQNLRWVQDSLEKAEEVMFHPDLGWKKGQQSIFK